MEKGNITPPQEQMMCRLCVDYYFNHGLTGINTMRIVLSVEKCKKQVQTLYLNILA